MNLTLKRSRGKIGHKGLYSLDNDFLSFKNLSIWADQASRLTGLKFKALWVFEL